MLHMSIPWWEFLIRGVVVYAFLIVLLRLTGKRQVGQLMSRAQLTHHELNAAIRQAGVSCPEDVHSAILENNGAISVIPKAAMGA